MKISSNARIDKFFSRAKIIKIFSNAKNMCNKIHVRIFNPKIRARILIANLNTRLFILCLLLPALILISAKTVAEAQTPSENPGFFAKGRVVLVVLDKVGLNDLMSEYMENVNEIIDRGAIALMNSRTGRNINSEDCALTMGAGSRGIGYPYARSCYNSTEVLEEGRVSDIFRLRTGYSPGEREIVAIDIAAIKKDNSGLEYTVVPGLIGEILRKSRLATAVIGNADTPYSHGRQAAAIAMDSMGIVDMGAVDKRVLVNDNEAPFGIRSDFEAILRIYDQVKEDTSFIVIETGDMTRFETYAKSILPAEREKIKERALRRIDRFIGELLERLDPSADLLLITTPSPSAEDYHAGKQLTPIIAWGAGMEPGLLYSSTTKRAGIIANIDISATVIDFFGIPIPSEMTYGRPVKSAPSEGRDPRTYLNELNRATANTYIQRRPVQKAFVLFQIIFVLGSVIGLSIIHSRQGRPLLLFLSGGVRALSTVPLVLLILPAFKPTSTELAFIHILLLTALVYCAVSLISKDIRRYYLYISSITALLIIVDLFRGAPLLKGSILGYDPIVGARYYGLGNEYMGILIGSTLMSASLLLDITVGNRKISGIGFIGALLLFIFVTAVIALPYLGANFGGTITALFAFGVALIRYKMGRINKRGLLILGLILAIGLSVFILIEILRRGDAQSHVGRLFSGMGTDGIAKLIQVTKRKASMNLKLIRYTIWTRVLIAYLVALAISFYRPQGLMRKVLYGNRYLSHGLLALLVGSFVTLAVNDSGIVAAATTIMFGTSILITLLASES